MYHMFVPPFAFQTLMSDFGDMFSLLSEPVELVDFRSVEYVYPTEGVESEAMNATSTAGGASATHPDAPKATIGEV